MIEVNGEETNPYESDPAITPQEVKFMWTRAELKSRAKQQMSGRYWSYLGASLMPELASYIISIPMSIISQIAMLPGFISTGMMSENSDFFRMLDQMERYGTYDPAVFLELYSAMLLTMILPGILIFLFSQATSIFILQPIIVGMNRWLIRSREERNISLSMCFSVFKKGSYLKSVWAMFYMAFFQFLWTCLFWIPGIIKSYAYRMIPYIIADNPAIGAKRALKLSCQMTRGHKFDIFILDLSFLGWYLLGMLACCIGVYGVVPYQLATTAELYDVLKKDAVAQGLCTMEELGYVRVAAPVQPAIPTIM